MTTMTSNMLNSAYIHQVFQNSFQGEMYSFLHVNDPVELSSRFLPGCILTFGLMGLRVGMSVPSALCLLESKTFLFFTADFWQILACFSCRTRKKIYFNTSLCPSISYYIQHFLILFFFERATKHDKQSVTEM